MRRPPPPSPRSGTPLRLRLVHGGPSGQARNPAGLLTGLLVLGIAAGIVHNRMRAQKRTDPALSAIRTVLSPFQTGGAQMRGGLLTGWDWVFRGRDISAENKGLRTEIARLRVENESLRKRAGEADRLKTVLKFVEAEKKPSLIGEVIGWLPFPQFETITVARGTRDGVGSKTVARTSAGLVGQVYDTSPFTAQIMLLTDVNSGVGALVQRNGKTIGEGIVQGTGRGLPLEMVDLKRESDVKPGDLVVTSGFGTTYPADIPIGVVVSVTEDTGRFLKNARITPAAPLPGDLREVLLLP